MIELDDLLLCIDHWSFVQVDDLLEPFELETDKFSRWRTKCLGDDHGLLDQAYLPPPD